MQFSIAFKQLFVLVIALCTACSFRAEINSLNALAPALRYHYYKSNSFV